MVDLSAIETGKKMKKLGQISAGILKVTLEEAIISLENCLYRKA